MSRLGLSLLALFLMASSQAGAQVKVFACEPEWAALTKELGGDKVKVFKATHAGQDPHHIQARPSLIARLRNADLAVCTGAELEIGWMPMLHRRARNPRVLPGRAGFFEATDHVALLDAPAELDRSHGDVHAAGNPHVQLDPRRIRTIARALSQRLQQLAPEHAAEFAQRWTAFDQRWGKAIASWSELAETLRGRKVVVHHREWVYLWDWLGIQRMGSLEPNPGIPPNLAHLAQLRDLGKPDMIILSPLNSDKAANWLHEQTGSPIVVLPHTVGATEGTDSLSNLFDQIIQRLLADKG